MISYFLATNHLQEWKSLEITYFKPFHEKGTQIDIYVGF